MFLQIKNTRINLDKISYYYYKNQTEYTKFTLFISFDGNPENEDIYTFENEKEGLELVERLDKMLLPIPTIKKDATC